MNLVCWVRRNVGLGMHVALRFRLIRFDPHDLPNKTSFLQNTHRSLFNWIDRSIDQTSSMPNGNLSFNRSNSRKARGGKVFFGMGNGL